MPTPQIKDEKTSRALRREGNSEEKSARIANAAAGTSRRSVATRGGRSPSYEDWTKKDLLQRARCQHRFEPRIDPRIQRVTIGIEKQRAECFRRQQRRRTAKQRRRNADQFRNNYWYRRHCHQY